MTPRSGILVWCLAVVFFIAGCATSTGSKSQLDINSPLWQGRMALTVDAFDAAGNPKKQSTSAGFELRGTAASGELRLFTPLGSTLAAIAWTPTKAVLTARGDTREFASLQLLLTHMLGTNIPVTTFFAWLNGQAEQAEGWQVDLSERSQGKILAQRFDPAPAAQLKLVLDQ